MGEFLRENWVWIVAPLVAVVLAVVVLFVLTMGDDSSAPFMYSLF